MEKAEIKRIGHSLFAKLFLWMSTMTNGKRLATALTSLFLILLLTGCGPGGPSKAEQYFLGAVQKGNLEEVRGLLAENPKLVNARRDDGWTSLHFASRGSKDMAELLIAKGADVNAKCLGYTPLHEASSSGHKELAELLIAKGAKVNAKSAGGSSPLHIAAYSGRTNVVELLIASGAKLNVRSKDGSTPLCFAFVGDHSETVALLRKHGATAGSEIIDALIDGNLSKAKSLIRKAPALVNANVDGSGLTALYVAAKLGYKDIAWLLVANGAKVDSVWKLHRETPLIVATDEGHTEIVKLLITGGANVNTRRYGYTPLHIAVSKGNREIVQLLIDGGANVNARDNPFFWPTTPLRSARRKGHKEIEKLLRKHGAVE